MKYILLTLFLAGSIALKAQSHKKYWSTGGEFIFSWADYRDSGQSFTGPPRFTCFLHLGARHNWDFNKYFGMGLGFGIRNIGFITEGEEPATKIKRRSYTLGAPLYFKVGNMDERKYVMFGGEYEVTFHYKFKRFLNGDKVEKVSGWFSDQTNRFLPSVFVAYNYKNVALKFQYYLEDMMNRNYHVGTGATALRPYAQTESRMFFVSVMFNTFNDKSVKPDATKPPTQKAFRF